MSNFRPIPTDEMPQEWRPKTHVSFRITLPASTFATSVDVLGSWDSYSSAVALEQDRRVGRDVWKGILSRDGGLEMGSEHYYYFLLDHKHRIPDPQSTPASMVIDSRTGKLVSVLYVPVELPPTAQDQHQPAALPFEKSISRVSVVGSSVLFSDFDEGGTTFEQPRNVPVPNGIAADKKGRGSLRDRLRVRRSISGMHDLGEPKAKRRTGWGLQLSVSTAFLRIGHKSTEEQRPVQPEHNQAAIRDIAGYLRSTTPTLNTFRQTASRRSARTHARPASPVSSSIYSQDQHSVYAASSVYSQEHLSKPPTTSPDMYPSFYSSEEEDDNEDEITTPVDSSPGLGIQHRPAAHQSQDSMPYPKYYNFDELKGGNRDLGRYAGDVIVTATGTSTGVRPLGYLREQVAGELKWRDEMVNELGYLGSVVL